MADLIFQDIIRSPCQHAHQLEIIGGSTDIVHLDLLKIFGKLVHFVWTVFTAGQDPRQISVIQVILN